MIILFRKIRHDDFIDFTSCISLSTSVRNSYLGIYIWNLTFTCCYIFYFICFNICSYVCTWVCVLSWFHRINIVRWTQCKLPFVYLIHYTWHFFPLLHLPVSAMCFSLSGGHNLHWVNIHVPLFSSDTMTLGSVSIVFLSEMYTPAFCSGLHLLSNILILN